MSSPLSAVLSAVCFLLITFADLEIGTDGTSRLLGALVFAGGWPHFSFGGIWRALECYCLQILYCQRYVSVLSSLQVY